MRSLIALTAVCLIAGCEGRTQVVHNPVVGPPPPRIPGRSDVMQEPERTGRSQLEEVVQVNAQDADDEPETGPLGPAGQVAARVNGTPIFTAEILEPYARRLAEVRSQVSPDQFQRLQESLVKRDLPQYIDQLVLYDKVTHTLEPDHRKQLDDQLDKFFQMHLEEVMKRNQLRTLAELQQFMEQTGTSLESAKRAFIRQQVSTQYLRESINADPTVSRTELWQEYEARHDDLTKPARVRWQQIRISFAPHGNRAGARREVQATLDDLAAGMSFAEAARTHSDGPLASHGGEWDWTQPESVSEDRLRAALAELTIGQVSEPIELERAFLIVKLTGSRPEETTPFEDVQDDLRESIRNRKREESLNKILSELKSNAVITTMFDGDTTDS